MSIVSARPAETTGSTAGLAGVVAGVLSGDWKVAVAALAGFLPAVVTFLKVHHGLRGIWRLIWSGSDGLSVVSLLLALLLAAIVYLIAAIFLPYVVALLLALLVLLLALRGDVRL